MSELPTLNDEVLEVSSLELAKLTGKQNKNVLRDIQNLVSKSASYDQCVRWSTYKIPMGRPMKLAVISGEILNLIKIKYFYGTQVKSDKVREATALTTIEQLLGVSLHREYMVGTHRIDGYDPVNNVAYEVDEVQHFVEGKLRAECKARQKYIEKALGCRFVRIKV